ncbi:tRNA isopentenyltransferase [Fomitiporia mediterranea MF3/22]|uniref:tRNA isopentenyltransferase n=1 Tax=Fomitiporia mediterranea (strain MF3/22) TaxID=694068 RepID=UPI0004409C71|nr:tRNA isopentenyltransferase [Fomitiporia mediterranea MF3/22]EJD02072.1 tRNA isopentenyltransferase [Fomitiporia mediterranea MF3/22]
MSLKPLIAICGTTGVGKSRLAVELALQLRGKVVNADAMQVYQGLDILTNKLPPSEQHGIEHVLMNFKKPGEQYVVGEWVRDASKEIDKAHEGGKVPIVIGGTAYWIHHLLFSNGLPAQAGPSKLSAAQPTPALQNALKTLPEELASLYNALPPAAPLAKTEPDTAFALHNLLSHLDPTMASRWHWRDTRKVLRNLEIIKENGRAASEVVTDTYSASTERRYRSLIFWLYAEPDVLNVRLEQRVDDMLAQGLLDEMRSAYGVVRETPDFTLGVFQSIGFREFYAYLNQEEKTDQLYETAVAEMKLNTIKYARRQVKWIRNKLLPALENANEQDDQSSDTIYLLDATDLSAWEENVLSNAKTIAGAFLAGSPTPEPASISDTAKRMLTVASRSTNPVDVMLTRRKLVCPVCTTEANRPVMLEEGREWEAHQRTSMHKAMQRKRDSSRVEEHS